MEGEMLSMDDESIKTNSELDVDVWGKFETVQLRGLPVQIKSEPDIHLWEELDEESGHADVKKKDDIAKVQLDTRLFLCNQCDYKAKQASKLRRHERIHTGERPFVCQVCGYSSRDRTTLRSHLFIHTGEKPYACTRCDYRSRHKSNLRKHEKRHDENKTIRCDNCPFAALSKASLRRHMAIHRGCSLVYECEECPFSSSYRYNLQRHMKKHPSPEVNATMSEDNTCSLGSYGTEKGNCE